MNNYLVIDTAMHRAVVGAVGDVVVVCEAVSSSRHGEALAGQVRACLAQAGWSRRDVDAIVVDIGPGSFTGVRVGLAMGKGLALAWGVPLAGVSSLDALVDAAGRVVGEGPMVAMVDAKKGEVFVARYEHARCVEGPLHLATQRVQSWLDAGSSNARIVGEVAAKLGMDRVLGSGCDVPTAESLAAAARRSFPWPPMDDIQPIYVRPPDITQPRVDVRAVRPGMEC